MQVFGDIKYELKIEFAVDRLVASALLFVVFCILWLFLALVYESHKTVVSCTAGTCRVVYKRRARFALEFSIKVETVFQCVVDSAESFAINCSVERVLLESVSVIHHEVICIDKEGACPVRKIPVSYHSRKHSFVAFPVL